MRIQQHLQHSPMLLSQHRQKFMAITLLFLASLFDISHPMSADAIPMSGDYRFDLPAVLVGTFTSDGTKTTAWDFTSPDFLTGVGPITWNSADLSTEVEFNSTNNLLLKHGLSSLSIVFSPYGNADQPLGGADIFVTVPCSVVEQCGGPTLTMGNIHIPWIPVPEATSGLLLAICLFSLVWFQWRQYQQSQS